MAKTNGSCSVSKITAGIEKGTTRTCYARVTLKGSKDKPKYIDHVECQWQYKVGSKDTDWREGSTENISSPTANPSGNADTYWACTYDAPENAVRVRVRARPVAKTYKKKNKDIKHFKTPSWSWATKDKTSAAFTIKSKQRFLTVKASINYDPSNSYVLTARMDPSDEDVVSSWNVSWYFWNGYYWTDPDTKDYNKGTRNVEYIGTIPEHVETIKLIVSPETEDPGYIAKSTTVRKNITLTTRKPKSVKIVKQSSSNRGILASWKIDNTQLIDSFQYEWEYWQSKRWQGTSSGTTQFANPSSAKDRVIYERVIEHKVHVPAASSAMITDTFITNMFGPKYTSGDVVFKNGYLIAYGTRKIEVHDYTWSTSEYTIPETASRVRFRVKAVGSAGAAYDETWTDWVEYEYKVPSRSIDEEDIKLVRQNQNLSRVLKLTWSIDNKESVQQYEIQWRYRYSTKKSSQVYGGGTTTVAEESGVPKITTYTPVDERVKSVEARIRPMPTYTNAFVPSWSKWVKYNYDAVPVRKVTNLQITTASVQVDRTLYATWALGSDWTSTQKSHIQNYECKWEYKLKTASLGDIWVEDNVSTTTQKFTQYAVHQSADEVRLTVRPVCDNDVSFDGDWCGYVKYIYDVKPRKVKNLKLVRESGTNRGLMATWSIDNNKHVRDYTYDYQGLRNGVWEDSSAEDGTTISQNCFFDAADNWDAVRIRVRPNEDTGNDLYFVGEFSNYVRYNFALKSRSVSNVLLQLQSGSMSTVIATWEMDNYEEVTGYEYEWRYCIDNIWLSGSSGNASIETPACTYDAPESASAVEFRVSPVPQYSDSFAPDWSDYEIIEMPGDIMPEVPAVPTVRIEGFTITAFVDTYDTKTSAIEFEVTTETESYDTGFADVIQNRATYSFEVEPGYTYRVRAAALNDEGDESEPSNWSEELETVPSAIQGTPKITATGRNSITLEWNAVNGSVQYEVEYTKKKRYFDAAPNQVQSGGTFEYNFADLVDLEEGTEWFFRIRAVNRSDSTKVSDWSEIVSIILGATPGPPTTWNSVNAAKVSDDVYLYWIHNCDDASYERSAQIELTVNGTTRVITVEKEEDEQEATSYYLIPANTYSNGATISWRVRTKGVMPDYGDWSIQRIVNLYTPPTVNIVLSDNVNWQWDPFEFDKNKVYDATGDILELNNGELTTFPLLVKIRSTPQTQTPVVYTVTLTSNDTYTSEDEYGNDLVVTVGDELFRRYYYTNKYEFVAVIDVSDVTLETGMNYSVNVTVAMDSGLNAVASNSFEVVWDDTDDLELDAEMVYDPTKYAMYIRPYSDHEDGTPVSNILLSVYRINFDGSFTEIAKNLSNIDRPTVTDPHPSLNYAKYRIVGRLLSTGKAFYYDTLPEEIGETSIVIQWNEVWRDYSSNSEELEVSDRLYNGTILVLPYNVNESDSNSMDTELVEYIGRKHPVSYYGTQVGQESSWSTDIVKADSTTLAMLRRLSVWPGDAYVRSPSGTGYWAHVEVSYDISHNSVITPVTLKITRVEGGV